MKKIGTHREGSWTRSLRLMPLRSSARFRKQLSLTGTTNGCPINTQRLTKASQSNSAHRNVTSVLSGRDLMAATDDQDVESRHWADWGQRRLVMSVCVDHGANDGARDRVKDNGQNGRGKSKAKPIDTDGRGCKKVFLGQTGPHARGHV